MHSLSERFAFFPSTPFAARRLLAPYRSCCPPVSSSPTIPSQLVWISFVSLGAFLSISLHQPDSVHKLLHGVQAERMAFHWQGAASCRETLGAAFTMHVVASEGLTDV